MLIELSQSLVLPIQLQLIHRLKDNIDDLDVSGLAVVGHDDPVDQLFFQNYPLLISLFVFVLGVHTIYKI